MVPIDSSEELMTLIATRISMMNHAVFQAYQEWLGEHVSPNWELMSEDWRRHNIRAVVDVMNKPFSQDDIGAQHQKWVESLTEQGYTLGAVKDHTAKTHPSLIPFSELSLTEKIKDFLFLSLSKAQYIAYNEGIQAGTASKDSDDEGSSQLSERDLDPQPEEGAK